jgi:hypothetical protein
MIRSQQSGANDFVRTCWVEIMAEESRFSRETRPILKEKIQCAMTADGLTGVVTESSYHRRFAIPRPRTHVALQIDKFILVSHLDE